MSEIHVDAATQHYSNGVFEAICSCGESFTGKTPDDADAGLVAHIEEHTVPVTPRDKLIATMLDYLHRLEDYDAPYVDDTYLDSVVIDGRMDFVKFADAILEALK